MTKTYRPYQPELDLLLPPSLRDWLPEIHWAYFVSDLVDQLDLSAIDAVYEKEARGQPPYDPRMMTKLLGYGYCVGFAARGRSSSGWEGRGQQFRDSRWGRQDPVPSPWTQPKKKSRAGIP